MNMVSMIPPVILWIVFLSAIGWHIVKDSVFAASLYAAITSGCLSGFWLLAMTGAWKTWKFQLLPLEGMAWLFPGAFVLSVPIGVLFLMVRKLMAYRRS